MSQFKHGNNFFIRIFILSVCVLTLNRISFAQVRKVLNLPNYEKEALHFGFNLGVNNTNFIVYPRTLDDSIYIVESTPQTGFNLGIISDLRVHDYVTLRFVPNLSFAQRNLDYSIHQKKGVGVYTKKVESTFLNFPIDLKVRSARLNNGAAYVLAGAAYTIDLASQKYVDNTSLTLTEQVIKLRKDDIALEAGVGVEFYLPYFKFALEGKLSLGIRNLLINDNTIFSNSIEKLNSKVFLLSITFEG